VIAAPLCLSTSARGASVGNGGLKAKVGQAFVVLASHGQQQGADGGGLGAAQGSKGGGVDDAKQGGEAGQALTGEVNGRRQGLKNIDTQKNPQSQV